MPHPRNRHWTKSIGHGQTARQRDGGRRSRVWPVRRRERKRSRMDRRPDPVLPRRRRALTLMALLIALTVALPLSAFAADPTEGPSGGTGAPNVLKVAATANITTWDP